MSGEKPLSDVSRKSRGSVSDAALSENLKNSLDTLQDNYNTQLLSEEVCDEEEEDPLTDAFKLRIGLMESENQEDNVVTEIELALDEEKEETISRFKFSVFSRKTFAEGNNGEFTSTHLSGPLLPKRHRVDIMASPAIFLAIQRFMGDLEAPAGITTNRDRHPVMSRIYSSVEQIQRSLNRRTSSSTDKTRRPGSRGGGATNGVSVNHKDDNNNREGQEQTKNEDLFKQRKRSSWRKFKDAIAPNPDKPTNRERRESILANSIYPENAFEMNKLLPFNELDIVHYIVGHGILRKDLRDEIFCQLCKQLTNNPKKASQEKGWLLMSLCSGCFYPSEKIIREVRCFIKDASKDFKTYAMQARRMLRRTASNGIRYHPPCWQEYEAIKAGHQNIFTVTYADGNKETISGDSATSASEMCTILCERHQLQDTFGYSVYISIYDKVSSLGSGFDHVMDAISECEQLHRNKGHDERSAPWKLFFRKEIFTPWHDPSVDEKSTDFVYQQVMRGIKSEEYRFKNDEDLAKYMARRHYVESGGEIIPGKVQQNLQNFLPESAYKDKSRDVWMQMVISALETQSFASDRRSAFSVKEEVVHNAPRRWPLQFSALFEAYRLSGPKLPRNDVIIAIGNRGLFILEGPYKIVLFLYFYELVDARSNRVGRSRGHRFNLTTINGEDYVFVSPNSETICVLLNSFIEGLRQRSRYAISLQNFEVAGEGAHPFSMKQGDFIELLFEDQADKKNPDWCYGLNCRTNKKGSLPYDSIYLLPAIEKPPEEFLKIFSKMGDQSSATLNRKRGAVVLSKGTIGRHNKFGKETAA